MTTSLPAAFVRSALALLFAVVPLAHGQGLKLNGPLARPVGGDIRSFELSPDGSRVVYIADQDADEVFELYAAKPNGAGLPRKLAGPSIAEGDVQPFGLTIGPRSRHVVFGGDLEVDGVQGLYSVPLAVGGAVKLSGSLVGTYAAAPSVRIDPAEKRVVFLAREGLGRALELYSVPIGGGQIVELNPQLVTSGNVSSFEISPDGTRVVYLADQEQDRKDELFSVPIDGGPAVKLSPPSIRSVVKGPRRNFVVDPSGRRVAFIVDLGVGLGTQLYSAEFLGQEPPRALLSAAVPLVDSLRVSPDGLRAVATLTQPHRLVSVPLDGSASVAQLHGAAPSGGTLEFTPDGRFVLFLAGPAGGPLDLLRVPTDGSSTASALSKALSYNGIRISPDGSRVVYPGLDGLSSTRIDGSSAPIRLAEWGANVEITPDGERVVFLSSQALSNTLELFSVPIAGGAEPVKLNGPLPFGGNLSSPGGFRIGLRGKRIVYLAEQRTDELLELFSVPADGSAAPVRLSGEMPIGPVEGDVRDFALSPGGHRAVYLADAEVEYQTELFSVSANGRGQPVLLNGALAPGERVETFRIAPDGSRVLYWFVMAAQNLHELRIVPIEGGPSAALAGPFQGSPYASFLEATDSRAVFTTLVAGTYTLFSVPLDGSSPAVVLHSAQGGLGSAEFTPDRQRLVYLADLDADYRYELFSVPLDGSATPTRLDGPRIPAGRVARFALTPDGSRAIYVADQLVEFKYELFSVPVDGSAVAVRLSQPLPSFGGVVRLRLVLAGGSVFYTASQDGTRAELFRVPFDGSAAPVKLSAPLVSRGNVGFFDVTPDGSRVVYQADQEVDERFELYSAPASGSGPVRKLNGALGRGIVGGDNYFDTAINVGVLAISPDGERVAFRAGPDNKRELFSAPIDGSAPAIEISAPLSNEGTVLSGFQFTADGKGVVYRAVDGFPSSPVFALFHAPLDVAGSAERISGIGTAFEYYQTLPVFALDGGRIFYLLDQETEGVAELFLDLLAGPHDVSGPRAKRSR